MPARRATPSTSPFFAPPCSTRSRVSGDIFHETPRQRPPAPSSAFSDTSTMWAWPSASKWVSAIRPPSGRGLRGSRRSRARDVGLAHEVLADEKAPRTMGREVRKVGGAGEAAFGDEEAAFRHAACKRPRGVEGRLEGLQVAVVDADERGGKVQRPVEFGGVMDLDEHVHSPGKGLCFKFLRLGVGDARHDDQDRVCAPGAGLRRPGRRRT